MENNERKNSEGYSDPTAYYAIKNAERDTSADDERFHKLLDSIFNICELSGFHITYNYKPVMRKNLPYQRRNF